MTTEREVLVPDIGEFKDIDVIDILVKLGDTIQVETPLITIESDKAAMEVRDADQKGLLQLAGELQDLGARAREGKLELCELQGGCFTISSLGAMGGTGFTPLVSFHEVAILGVSRATMKPVYRDGDFIPRLILPLSLSYDHRVIDGVAAAAFCCYLSEVLSDIREILL